jgi:hypothetical protein
LPPPFNLHGARDINSLNDTAGGIDLEPLLFNFLRREILNDDTLDILYVKGLSELILPSPAVGGTRWGTSVTFFNEQTIYGTNVISKPKVWPYSLSLASRRLYRGGWESNEATTYVTAIS